MNSRSELIAKIEEERSRQQSLPGSEYDLRNTPNDWIAIAGRYLGESCRRGSNFPFEEEFRDSLIKSAAVILAALEHIPRMIEAESLGGSE